MCRSKTCAFRRSAASRARTTATSCARTTSGASSSASSKWRRRCGSERKRDSRLRRPALRRDDRARLRGARQAGARRAPLYAFLRRHRHQGELARLDEVGQGEVQERELQRAPGEALRRHSADPWQGGDRSRDRRPAALAQAPFPQRVGAHAAGLEVRRLAVLPSAYVMEFKGRREDDRLLTGRGQYTADWNLPGQLYGVFLRSDRAHAEIVTLKMDAALRHPGVEAVLAGEDTASFKTPPPMVTYPGIGGAMIKVPHLDVIARKRVRYVGQEVALVVATSASAAQDAAEAIEVEYRDLPSVVDAEAALAPGAPQLHDDVPGNLCFDYVYGDEKATDEAFARAAHVTRIKLESTRVSGTPMEPKACVVAYDAETGAYDIHAPSQGLAMMLPNFAAITGVPADKIRIHARDVGGGFGIRSQAYPEYCALMAAAKKVGRPVKWVGSRFETIVGDHHGRAARLEGELALERDGRFLGLRVRWVVNMGAFLSQPGPLINTRNPASHAINVYRIPALHGRHRLALTNTTSTTAYRGAGRPNASYLIERLVDEAARELRLDRVEIRRRNFIPKEAFPYKTPAGSTYDSGDPAGEFEEALEKSDWDSFEQRRRQSASHGKLRGIGCAVFCEPSGAGHAPKEEAVIKFGESGNP